MHHHYVDIRERIREPPKWWDENAVPRYCEFGPESAADIYANEVVLLRIECQGCGEPFDVCMSWPRISIKIWTAEINDPITAEEIQTIHYGDPPNNGCCAAGATMNSVPRRVLQFWRRSEMVEWERVPELERSVDCDWSENE